jgi:hypothetical protein
MTQELKIALKLRKEGRYEDAEQKFREIIEIHRFIGIPSFHLAEMYRLHLRQ